MNFFSAFNASCWPLGGGFYSRIEPDFHLLAQLMRLPIRLSLCLLPVSKLTNGGIESCLLVPSRFNDKTRQETRLKSFTSSGN